MVKQKNIELDTLEFVLSLLNCEIGVLDYPVVVIVK